jgi:hypothetical protein
VEEGFVSDELVSAQDRMAVSARGRLGDESHPVA